MKRILTILFLTVLLFPMSTQNIKHSWQGKKVGYLGDSVTDPLNDGSKLKYWNFLRDWLKIEPYVYAVSGLYPLMDEFTQYFKNADNDRLHPNDEGHKRLVYTLMYQLLTLPCDFE